MSRESMTSLLLGELYEATAHRDDARPMHRRRIKRLMNIDGDCGETINRCAAAWVADRRAKP